MTKPDYLDQLINLASEKAGSDYKLAQMLESSRSAVSDWRHGRKTCPIADVALMAHIAGLDPAAWVARATVSPYEGSPKGDKLFIALGKALVATGAVIASSGASAQALSGECVSYLIRCIERLSYRALNYRSFNLA